MSDPAPQISVIVPARDAAALIGPCLDALAGQVDAPAHEVIVVDNGSLDDTAAVAAGHPLRPRVLRRPRGAGPGAARNDGAAAARGAVLAFTDADCRPRPRWLAAGMRAIGGAELVQGRVEVEGPAGPFDHTLSVGAEYGLYESANLFVRADAFAGIGGFEDIVVTHDRRPFGEDVWFAWRLRRSGGRTAFSREAAVAHAVLPGDWREYLRERRRDGAFAELARRVPELRGRFFFGPCFFTRRSAALDAALLGALAAGVTRSPVPLVAAAPYGLLLARETRRRSGVLSRRVALVVAAGDLIGAAALLRGSLAARTPLL